MAFAGFDRSSFPGEAIMQKLRSTTNLRFCGYYLAPAPSHSDTSYMGKLSFLQNLGFGIVPLYVGEQVVGPGSRNPSSAKGTTDGNDAVEMMRSEGFADGSCVYLDLENGPPLNRSGLPLSEYVNSWCDAVSDGGFLPGIYCSHSLAGEIQQLQPNARIFAFRVTTTAPHEVPGPPFPEPDPDGSGFADAFAFQHQQNALISVPGEAKRLQVDLDSANAEDPSNPAAVA
jgi:hypothetical protein